ncbi:MAG: 50S ribosomal protein L30 [Desulfovibrionaceae bacterium]
MLKVKLVRSAIGCSPRQRQTLAALGLKKIRQEKTFQDNNAVRGMISKVVHLVEVSQS